MRHRCVVSIMCTCFFFSIFSLSIISIDEECLTAHNHRIVYNVWVLSLRFDVEIHKICVALGIMRVLSSQALCQKLDSKIGHVGVGWGPNAIDGVFVEEFVQCWKHADGHKVERGHVSNSECAIEVVAMV